MKAGNVASPVGFTVRTAVVSYFRYLSMHCFPWTMRPVVQRRMMESLIRSKRYWGLQHEEEFDWGFLTNFREGFPSLSFSVGVSWNYVIWLKRLDAFWKPERGFFSPFLWPIGSLTTRSPLASEMDLPHFQFSGWTWCQNPRKKKWFGALAFSDPSSIRDGRMDW